MLKRWAFWAAALLTAATATAEVQRMLAVSAWPLQAYNALTVDWQLRMWSGAVGAVSEARPGGIWRLTYEDGRLEEGLYEQAVGGEGLVFSFMVNEEATRAEIVLSHGGDSTAISIRHSVSGSGHAAEQMEDSLAAWWDARLPLLAEYLNRTPGAYIALPGGEGPFPAVLLLHDRFGPGRTARGFCDSLAKSGYVAVAVDLFRGETGTDASELARFADTVGADGALHAARMGIEHLRSHSDVRAKRIAVWGLGLGGELALQLATNDPRIKYCVVWHSTGLPAAERLSRIACPVLAVFGDYDVTRPQARIVEFQRALIQAAVRAETVVVPGGFHFSDPGYGESYSRFAVEEAWRRTLLALDKQLRL